MALVVPPPSVTVKLVTIQFVHDGVGCMAKLCEEPLIVKVPLRALPPPLA